MRLENESDRDEDSIELENPKQTREMPEQESHPKSLDETDAFATLDPNAEVQLSSYGEGELSEGEQSGDKPTYVGPYRILKKIAEGGMGAVYLAQQNEPIRRKVALKVIKSGRGSDQIVSRFEAERQALAMMSHQNIAKILDAGTTVDGLPFFAMELVDGEPITRYCDRNKLSIRERLKLFVSICQAVQHAHLKGIIHRDLKPSNILVATLDGKPVPKVIDFGLAKATEHQRILTDGTNFTEFGQVVGTLQYMSPEQAGLEHLDVDTRTDVYSLGVILYELVAGSTPLERESLGRHAVLKVLELIRDHDPPRPSARLSSSGESITGVSAHRKIQPSKLQRILKGELDWIVMKSLEKDRTRRYDTASSFAEDVRRFLDHEPVLAKPPSASYRLGKFVSKNRGFVASASAILLLLAAGLSTSLILLFKTDAALAKARRASVTAIESAASERVARESEGKAKNLAESRLKQVKKANQLLAGIFDELNVQELRKDGKNVETAIAGRLISTADELSSDLSEAPLDVALLQRKLGIAAYRLGFVNESIPILESALQKIVENTGSESSETLRASLGLVPVYLASRRLEDAQRLIEVAEQNFSKSQSSANVRHPEIVLFQSELLSARGKVKESLQLALEVYQRLEEKHGPKSESTIKALAKLVQDYHSAGEPRLAVRLGRKCLTLFDQQFGPDHANTLAFKLGYGAILQNMGQGRQARKLFEPVYEGFKELYGPDNYQTQLAKTYLTSWMTEPKESLPIYEEVAEKLREEFGEENIKTVQMDIRVAMCHSKLGSNSRAEEILLNCAERLSINWEDKHPVTLEVLSFLSQVFQNQKKFESSLAIDERVLQARREKFGDRASVTLESMNNLATSYTALGRYDEALPLLVITAKIMEEELGADHLNSMAVQGNLARAYRSAGDAGRAIEILEPIVQAMKSTLPENHPYLVATLAELSICHSQLKQFDQAVEVAWGVYQGQLDRNGVEHPDVKKLRNNYVRILIEAGRSSEAIQHYLDVIKELEEKLGGNHQLTLAHVHDLSNFYLAEKDLANTTKWHKVFFERQKVALAKRPDVYAMYRSSVAYELVRAGEPEAAEPMLLEALEYRTKELPDSWLTHNSNSLLGEIYLTTGRIEEAKSILEESAAKLKESAAEIPLKSRFSRQQESLQRLIDLAKTTKNTVELANWQDELRALQEEFKMPMDEE